MCSSFFSRLATLFVTWYRGQLLVHCHHDSAGVLNVVSEVFRTRYLFTHRAKYNLVLVTNVANACQRSRECVVWHKPIVLVSFLRST